MKLEILGTQLNTWGLYCAIGALCAAAAMSVVCINRKMKPASIPVLGLLSLVFGIVCSRAVYCLFMTMTTIRMPFSSWLRVTDGGWSLFGMIGGVMLAAWISARITGEKPKQMLDAVSVALPLMIAAERLGEGMLQPMFEETKDLFNLSRPIAEKGFLTITNQNKIYLATFRIDAILVLALFLVLVFSLMDRKILDGDLWIRFMILCGAGGIAAESLRFDDFLVYSFVRIQQVMAALMLIAGVILSGRRSGKGDRRLYITALSSAALAVAGCIGLEFALDRVNVSHSVLYIVMITALLIPVIEGMILMRRSAAEDGGYGRSGGVLTAAIITGMVLSAAEFIVMRAEMGWIHRNDKYLLIVLLSAAGAFAVHGVMLFLNIRDRRRTGGPDLSEGER